jgi:NAD(P)-dependent dehydrogenase (short-subunit alcohol dehydrogenase family)
MSEQRLLLPFWRITEEEYRAVCAHLGVTPRPDIYDRLSLYLASAPFRFPRPEGFARFLSDLRLTRFRVARLDSIAKLFPALPFRHVVNAVLAMHECDAGGYSELAGAPTRPGVLIALPGWVLAWAGRVALTLPWLAWWLFAYALDAPFRRTPALAGEQVLITGVNRGLGLDLLLHCLELGATVVGTVRNIDAQTELRRRLPAEAPVTLLVADLSQPDSLATALEESRIEARSLRIAIVNAGVKHDGASVLSLATLHDTFQVNCFSVAELARWFCGPRRQNGKSAAERERSKQALVLISSMGRWHGMQFVGGYNASKAALSIWGESLDMELRSGGIRNLAVTIVEPGLFDSGMVRRTALAKLLFASRDQVSRRIVAGAMAGARVIRPPAWFALLTWIVCLGGRDFRYWLFSRVKGGAR